MSRVAIAGHSMGGSTAILAIGGEPRFKAAVVIDGVLAHTLNSTTETPVFQLTAGHEQWSYTERRVWEQLQGPRLDRESQGRGTCDAQRRSLADKGRDHDWQHGSGKGHRRDTRLHRGVSRQESIGQTTRSTLGWYIFRVPRC